jgi:NitT/TauT family transport system permease protein
MMIRQPISTPARIALGILSIAMLIGGYCWLAQRQYQINPTNTAMPRWSQFQAGWSIMTGQENGQGFAESWLWEDSKATFGRLAIGVTLGVALSLIVGMAMGCFPAAEAFFSPPLSLFARIPPTAMLVIYLLLFGFEQKMFIAMISLGIFPTLAQSIYQAAKKDVSEHAVFKAYTLGASPLEVILSVIFQQVLPRIIESIRLHIGPAMVFLIAAEWVVADVGFGYRLRILSRMTRMNIAYTYLLILGFSGFAIDWSLSLLRRRLSPWFGE